MTSVKRQVSYGTLLEEAGQENSNNAVEERIVEDSSELALKVSAARRQADWDVLTGVPGDGADLGRFFSVAVPRGSPAAVAYAQAKGLGARRKAAAAVFAAKVCWVKPNASGVDLSQPWSTKGPEADVESLMADLSADVAQFKRSDPPPPGKDPNFALFPCARRACESGRKGVLRPVDMNVVADSNLSLAQIGEEIIKSVNDDKDSYGHLGTCLLHIFQRASEGAVPKTLTDAAVAPSHGPAGPPSWAREPAGALAGPWDASADVRGIWPAAADLKLEAIEFEAWDKLPASAPSRFEDLESWDVSFEGAPRADDPGALGTMEPIEWSLRPDEFRPPRMIPSSRKRSTGNQELAPELAAPWDAEFIVVGWQPLPDFGALEVGDPAIEGPPRPPLEQLWRNSQRRRVRVDFLIGHFRSEQALATVAGESPSAKLAEMLGKLEASKEVEGKPIIDNNVSSKLNTNVSNELGNKLPTKTDTASTMAPSEPLSASRMIAPHVSHTLPKTKKSKKIKKEGDESDEKDARQKIVARWNTSNPGRPAYEVLAAHRRSPRWRDYDSAGLANWHESFKRSLSEGWEVFDKVASSPETQLALDSRKRNMAEMRESASLAGLAVEVSWAEQKAEAMASASSCVFRSQASEAVDSSLGGRWSFKVCSGSVSPPPIAGYALAASVVRPSPQRLLFLRETGCWEWKGHEPKNALNCTSEELAERFGAAPTCVFRDNRSVLVDCSVHPRWSFKVLGRSVSKPPVMEGYQLPAPTKPSFLRCKADAGLQGRAPWASWTSSPGKDRARLKERLAKKMAKSDRCIYRSFPQGWAKALLPPDCIPEPPSFQPTTLDNDVSNKAIQSGMSEPSLPHLATILSPRLTKPLLSALDKDGSGDLDRKEFTAFQMVLASLSDHFAADFDGDELFEIADVDSSGLVDEQEFARHTGALLDVLKMEGVCPSIESLVALARNVVGKS